MNFDSLESFLSRFCHTYHSYVDLSSFPVFLSTRAIAHVMLDVESYRFCCWLVVATARSGRMMIMDSDTLREARKHLGLSQMEAAELLEVSLVTYQRCEQGKARPQPYHLRLVSPAMSSADGSMTEVVVDESSGTTMEPITLHLLSCAFMAHPTNNDRPALVRQAIKECDSVNSSNKNYQITRREAISTLASLPLATLALTMPGSTVQPTQYAMA